MHAAPPVEVRLGSGRRERTALVMVWALAGLSLGAWAAAHGGLHVGWSFAAASAGALCGLLIRPRCGWLAWDGQSWHWRADRTSWPVQASGLRVAVDLGRWVLLRDDAGRWCGMAVSDAAGQWHGLRLALHARQAAATGSGR